jgi:hypothetical protein
VARILLLLAVLFAFCWLPYNLLALLFDLGVNNNMKFFSYTLLLGHANSAINPILYCFMTRNFRRAVLEFVLCSRVSLATRPHQRCNVSTVRGLVSSRTFYTIPAHKSVVNLSTNDSYWAICKFIVQKRFKFPYTCILILFQRVSDKKVILIRKLFNNKTSIQICLSAANTGRFIMFSVITNIYNKKTKGPTLMELFTDIEKLKKFFI